MEVSASISYIINPEASTSVCRSSSQDANACFEVYGITKGNIAVYAFWQRWKLLKVNNSDINCNNNSKKFSFPLPPIHSSSCHSSRDLGGKRINFVNYHVLGA